MSDRGFAGYSYVGTGSLRPSETVGVQGNCAEPRPGSKSSEFPSLQMVHISLSVDKVDTHVRARPGKQLSGPLSMGRRDR